MQRVEELLPTVFLLLQPSCQTNLGVDENFKYYKINNLPFSLYLGAAGISILCVAKKHNRCNMHDASALLIAKQSGISNPFNLT